MIQRLIALFREQTTDSITAALSKTVARLERHAERSASLSIDHADLAEFHTDVSLRHGKEASHARRVATKVRDLVA